MSKQRIIFYCSGSIVAGAEIISLSIMEVLKKRGHDILCITSAWNDGHFIERLRTADIDYSVLKLGFLFWSRPLWTLDSLLHYPGAIIRNLLLVKRFHPDWNYHVSYRSVVMLLPWLKHVPSVLHVHDLDGISRRNKLLYQISGSQSSVVIAVSEAVGENLRKLGVENSKIRVIHNGVAFDDLHRSPRLSPLHWSTVNTAAVGADAPRIGIVGQILPRKGHQDLLAALRILRDGGVRFECLIFGKGDETFVTALQQEAEKAGLSPQIRWMGFLEDRDSIYSQLDIVVVPTRDSEPFGLVAVEPALWEIPVVASRNGGLTEIIVDGRTGFLFEPGNVNDLATKLCRLLVDPALRKEVGEKARQHVRVNFSLEVMLNKIESLLAESDLQVHTGAGF